MKALKQTLTDTLFGNCLQACIASVLEKELDHVPNFMLFEDHWWSVLIMWLGTNGYEVEYIEGNPPNDNEYYVTSLKYDSHGKGIAHAVVMKDNEIAHNPWINDDYNDKNYDVHGYYELTKTINQ